MFQRRFSGKPVSFLIQSFTSAFAQRLLRRPNAWAAVRSKDENSRLLGTLKLYQTTAGVLTAAEFWGLPDEGRFLLRLAAGPDRAAPADCLPVVFANRGYGWCVGLTSRFAIRDVMGMGVELCLEGPEKAPALASGVIR